MTSQSPFPSVAAILAEGRARQAGAASCCDGPPRPLEALRRPEGSRLPTVVDVSDCPDLEGRSDTDGKADIGALHAVVFAGWWE